MKSEAELEQFLSTPSQQLVEDLARLDGDILVLGAGGKMGPSLARMAQRAVEAGGGTKRVIAVSRFNSETVRQSLEQAGVETIAADLSDVDQLLRLPDAKNVIYMVGYKFGTTGQEHVAWAMNAFLPGLVAQRYTSSRIVAFSTGSVYPLTPPGQGGCTETTPPAPIGEYAQSCLGRERVLTYFSHKYGTPMVLIRLNYAIDLRYGVLLDIAKDVYAGRPIDLRMGQVNVIWQGDANEIVLRALRYCASPPLILNLTGPETVSVRWIAEEFGRLLGRTPKCVNVEADTALLSNASKAHQMFGYPRVTLRQMMAWVAEWVLSGGRVYDKPTHFQEREGKF